MLTAILLDRGINFASEPANEPKSFGRWTYSKMDVALNVDVVLLDIGRSVLKPFSSLRIFLARFQNTCAGVTCIVIEISFFSYPTLPTNGALTAVRQRERCVRYPSSKMSW
jgi:hypothetical protein